MLTFTLDTNCIIDLEEGRPQAASVRALADAHAMRAAEVALVAVSASERQPGDRYLENYGEFTARAKQLRLDHLTVLPTITYWGIGFWGIGFWGGDEAMTKREADIHQVLFPNRPFEWPAYAAENDIHVDDFDSNPMAQKWRNAFCDRQMYWAHDHAGRDVFVTRDANFRRLLSAPAFAGARIMEPDEAASLL